MKERDLVKASVLCLFVILGWSGSVSTALAQRVDSAITIGASATLWSDVLRIGGTVRLAWGIVFCPMRDFGSTRGSR